MPSVILTLSHGLAINISNSTQARDCTFDRQRRFTLKVEYLLRIYGVGAINRHKTGQTTSASGYPSTTRPRNNVYVNPNYKPPSRSSHPTAPVTQHPRAPETVIPPTSQKRDVVIGGIAFESSGRSLVRKDRMLSSSATRVPSEVESTNLRPTTTPTVTKQIPVRPTAPPISQFPRNKPQRIYKPRSSAHRGRPTNRNMTLNNTRRAFQFVWSSTVICQCPDAKY